MNKRVLGRTMLCKVPRSVNDQKAWGTKLQCINGSQWLGRYVLLPMLTIN